MPSRLASLEPPAPCAECQTRTPGLKWGDLCPECRGKLVRRARPWARRISLIAALGIVAYAYYGMRLSSGSRIWVAGIAIAAYFLVNKIVTQIAVEYLRPKPPK